MWVHVCDRARERKRVCVYERECVRRQCSAL